MENTQATLREQLQFGLGDRLGKAHQLRHYYASELLDNGVDIRVVKELMRHESIATTEIYTRVNMRHMRDGLSVLKSAA